MASLELSDELVEKLCTLAQSQQRSINVLLADILQQYKAIPTAPSIEDRTPEKDPLVGLIGLLDEIQETDLSSMNG